MLDAQRTSRLVPSPVFLLSAPRSGSTLLRNILNTHSQIHSTTELVLTELGVQFLRFPADLGMHTILTELAFDEAGLPALELEHLLWDRILHHSLECSGKSVLVHKAPRVLLRWQRLAECWPEARYIFLLRHPINMMVSARESTGRSLPVSSGALTDHFLRYLYLLQQARTALPGLTVRYEDLTTDPMNVCQELCKFLDVGWEPGMLEYGSADQGPAGNGAGDISRKLASGRPQPGRAMPPREDIPLMFRSICADLGYLSADEVSSRAD